MNAGMSENAPSVPVANVSAGADLKSGTKKSQKPHPENRRVAAPEISKSTPKA